ncbi:hypothetical protein GCM10010216_51070 [Streptomyces flaveolus]|nr:hypothetical protein GCM10010216_51070 [Streptomyces flaveolus]
MVQPGQDHCFAVHVVPEVGTGVGPEDLDRHRSPQPQVETAMDVRGSAGTEETVETVPAAQDLGGASGNHDPGRLANPHSLSHRIGVAHPW